jgi:hypothetical protein
MLHFNITSSIQIQNLRTYKNYHSLVNTKSSLGRILQGKCFAAPIVSLHLQDSFSIQWTKLFVVTVLLFFSIQSFLRNWMEFEFHVLLCCKCQNLNEVTLQLSFQTPYFSRPIERVSRKHMDGRLWYFISCIPAYTISTKHIFVVIMYTVQWLSDAR